jgi:type IX secretion system substrate protein
MKTTNLYKTLFLLVFFLPSSGFSQIINEYNLSGTENRFFPSDESMVTPHSNYSAGLRSSDDLLIARRTDDWIDNAWTGRDSLEYFYDVNDNIASSLWKSWDDSSWVNVFQASYEYDTNNNITLSSWQSWDGNIWVNSSQIGNEYDANNNIVSSLWKSWDGSSWVIFSQTTYEYDINNSLVSELRQSWDGSNWVNSYQYAYEYDVNNNQTYYLGQSWDGSSWINAIQTTNEYDTINNLTSSLRQNWLGGSWVNNTQFMYEYDSNDNLILKSSLFWIGGNWIFPIQTTYEYDENNNLLFELDQSGTEPNLVNLERTYHYYQIINSIGKPEQIEYSIQFFPNPSKGDLTIDLGENDLANGNLHIYNSLGQLVLFQVIQNGEDRKSFDLSNFSEGTYFLQIKHGDKQTTQVFIIAH